VTCKHRYEQLRGDRDYYLDRARSSSRLTLPYLIPRSNDPGRGNKDVFTLPWNGIGARGVHNLASRLLLALLPPTESFFRFTVDEAASQQQEMQWQQQGASEEKIAAMKSEIELTLNRLELAVLRSIETSNDRVAVHEAMVHLIVAGNCLLFVSEDGLQCFHLNRYVLLRDQVGNPVEAVVCEEMALEALPAKVQEILKGQDDELKGILDGDDPAPKKEKNVRLFTHVTWENDGKVHWHQEVKDQVIEGTEGSAPIEASPWLPLRMIRQDGSSYGPGYIESACIADLQTAEALSQAITEGALISAQVKHLVKPSGVTNAKQLADAANGAYLPGNPEDVFTVQTGKGNDLNVALTALARIEARLAQAMMLADVRDSERTTAEEVRLQAQQIENSLGSIYAILTVEFQAPYIARKLELFQRQTGQRLPKDMVKPMVSVGLAAVGRGNDLEKTARFMQILQQTIGPEGLAQYVVPTELIKRLASAMGINPLGLVKTEQQLAAEAQQQQQMAMAQQAMAAGMADPQKLANAAATTQEMAAPQPPADQPTEPPA
jgi:hypothetical protein